MATAFQRFDLDDDGLGLGFRVKGRKVHSTGSLGFRFANTVNKTLRDLGIL